MGSLVFEALRGERLLTLRNVESVTQAELAKTLGVGQAFISRIESGSKPLPRDLAVAAASEYGVPLEFFSVAPSVTDSGTPTFRKSSTATVKDERKVLTAFDEAARLFYQSSEESDYYEFNIAGAVDDDPEETASNIRSILGLAPEDPLLNATRAAERLGVGVVHDLVPDVGDDSKHHGISKPSRQVNRPLIATVSEQPPAVSRMTMMHELGHVIYDRNVVTPWRSTKTPEEERAFRFAGAMLIPANVLKKRVSDSLTLHGYLAIKADYGVSVGALVKRAESLGIITKTRARSLYIQMSSQGWRYNEPVPVAAERPLLIQQATTRAFGKDPEVVARSTGAPFRLVAHWMGLEQCIREPIAEVIPFRR